MNLFPATGETLAGALSDLKTGRCTSRDLVERCLAAIDQRESEIQAWVRIDRDGALESADKLDADRRTGNATGPLHGIPLGIKDIVDVAGWPTKAGSPLREEHVAGADAPVVKRLRGAGAVFLGKTVTTQFASFDPPVTRNPWNLDRTPGGSSSGSAAAVAAGMCLGAVGSQTGGSITRPAAFCGIAGMKPAFGKLPLEGIVPLSAPMDHPGPLARTVRDTEILYRAMAGESASSLANESSRKPPTLALLGGFFQEAADGEMLSFLMHAWEQWIHHGAIVESIPLPAEFDQVIPMHRIVMARGAADCHREQFTQHADQYAPAIRSLIEEGLRVSDADWNRALEFQSKTRERCLALFEEVDVLITPASVGPAPDAKTTGDPIMNSPWSFNGFPTVTFPIGLSPEGLPMGVQLIGRPDREDELFRAAIWCEDVIREFACGSEP